jgi:hypothetical protein
MIRVVGIVSEVVFFLPPGKERKSVMSTLVGVWIVVVGPVGLSPLTESSLRWSNVLL